jgi:hypothetical protein
MSLATATTEVFSLQLTPSDAVFIRTVLEHRGVGHQPTAREFAAAMQILRRYEEQCRDNPREPDAWEPPLGEESQAELRAKAFLMFGATKPLPSQWHKAHAALYGPLLCETCG